MDVETHLGKVADLVGEKRRLVMLWNMLGGRAVTATELAASSDTSPQSASMHLAILVRSGLVKMEKQGRHRYYRVATPEAAYAIESMGNLVPKHKLSLTGEQMPSKGVRYCRTCYDHLAGLVAVKLTDQLLKLHMLSLVNEEFALTAKGVRWFGQLGVNINELKGQRRSFARACLDWSERRHHLAGALGAALLVTMRKADWVRSVIHSREMIVTSKGRLDLHKLLRLEI